jgi:hypothetical protein
MVRGTDFDYAAIGNFASINDNLRNVFAIKTQDICSTTGTHPVSVKYPNF